MGGQGLEYWGAKGGPNSQQAHDVVMTSMRRNDVASTSFRRHVPKRFLINQCQIITFLILKCDIIENSRIELRGIVLPVQVDALLGGPKGMLAPLSNYWGGLAPPCPPPPPPPPLPTPMSIYFRLSGNCKQCDTRLVFIQLGIDKLKHTVASLCIREIKLADSV